jgi:hypothetical protein
MTALALVTAVHLILPLAADQPAHGPEQREPVQGTLAFDDAAAAKTVVIDDVFGSVEVTGTASGEVRVIGEKTVRAETPEAEARARREVTLDMSQSANRAEITVNGPFRRRDGSLQWSWDDRRYVVRYDLKVAVPETVDLVVKTVNDGHVLVRNVRGNLTVRNVNGTIDLEKIAGSVDARTVNGGIRALFNGSPAADCDFKTVNGDVHLSFGSDLAADFSMKTLNGELRSDYDVTTLPARPGQGRRENGRYVYRSDRALNVRVGRGGPQVAMETLNGDLIVASK